MLSRSSSLRGAIELSCCRGSPLISPPSCPYASTSSSVLFSYFTILYSTHWTSRSGSNQHKCLLVALSSAPYKPAIYHQPWPPGYRFNSHLSSPSSEGEEFCLRKQNISPTPFWISSWNYNTSHKGNTIHVNTPKCSRRRGR